MTLRYKNINIVKFSLKILCKLRSEGLHELQSSLANEIVALVPANFAVISKLCNSFVRQLSSISNSALNSKIHKEQNDTRKICIKWAKHGYYAWNITITKLTQTRPQLFPAKFISKIIFTKHSPSCNVPTWNGVLFNNIREVFYLWPYDVIEKFTYD